MVVSYRLTYNEREDMWHLTKNGNHVSWHRKKGAGKREGKRLAKKANETAKLRVKNRTKPGGNTFTYNN